MKDLYRNTEILFFIKYPEPGRVKTRLAASIGMEEAAGLYGNFILDTLEKIGSLGVPIKICFHPEGKKELLMDWLGEEHHYCPQRGNDLGERMRAAFLDAFSGGCRRVILIGSDFPDLPISVLKESLDVLNTHDVVVGPSVDGGYYLIGFRDEAFSPIIFDGMDWGTELVFRNTLSVLKAHKLRVYILPAWNDVDTIEDLKQLMSRAECTDFSGSRTMSYLSNSTEKQKEK